MTKRIAAKAPKKIGLCLSGGGFRATLFHLGVIEELRNRGILSNIKVICGVSGGSILAAHLALRWGYYTGDAAMFSEVADQVINFTRKDVRGRLMRSLPVQGAFGLARSATQFLVKEYTGGLYGKTLLNQLSPDAPRLELISTSLGIPRTPCSFSRTAFSVWREDGRESIDSGATPLSFAVAASSAFPALFPPLRCDNDLLKRRESDTKGNAHYLTDGGVLDNSGLRVLSQIVGEEELEQVIFSDAGAELDWLTKARLDARFRWYGRTVQILADNAADLAQKDGVASIRALLPLVEMHISDSVKVDIADSHGLPWDAQKQLQQIRTDLDVFTPHEIRCLILHGQAIARKVLLPEDEVVREEEDYWDPMERTGEPAGFREPDRALEGLRHSSKRRFRPLARDIATLVNIVVITGLLLSLWLLDRRFALRNHIKREYYAFVERRNERKQYTLTGSVEELRERLRESAQPDDTVVIQHLGLDLDHAWTHVKALLEKPPKVARIEYRLLMLTTNSKGMGPLPPEVEQWQKKADENFIKMDGELRAIVANRIGKNLKEPELDFCIRKYSDLPLVHGFNWQAPGEKSVYYICFCRWDESGPGIYRKFNWGETGYFRILSEETARDKVSEDFAKIFNGYFNHYWKAAETEPEWSLVEAVKTGGANPLRTPVIPSHK
jgi:predicted acylesterase/phospholipase RssA